MELSSAEKAELIQLIEQGLPLPGAYRGRLFPDGNPPDVGALPAELVRLHEWEAALASSEERWQLALEGVGDGVWDWDVATGQVFFSKPWKAMLGYTDAEIPPELAQWETRLHPEDHDRVLAELQKYFSGASPLYCTEHRLRCKDGSYKWILDRGKVVSWSADGRPQRMVGLHTDLTQAKRTQERLEQSEFWLIESQRVSRIGSYVLDIASGDWTSTATLDEIFGIGPDFPHDVQGWGEVVHPLDRQLMLHYFASHVVQERNTFDKEYRIQRVADGAERWVHGRGALFFNAEGAPVQMAGTIQDVTERVLAQQALRQERDLLQTLMDTIPDPVYIKDSESRFVRINQAQARLLGVAEPAMALGKSDADFFSPEEAAWRLEGEQAIIASGQPQIGLLEHITLPHSAPAWYTVTKIARVDGGGNIEGIIGISHDITEIMLAQEKLREQQERYSALVNTTQDGCAVLDCDLRILEVNVAYCTLMGYQAGELVGQRLHDLNIIPDVEQSRSRVANMLQQGWGRYESQQRRRDGTMVDLEVNVTVIRPSNHLIVFLTDITERLKAQQQLRNLAQMLELAPLMISVHDAEGKFHYFNRRAFEMHGYSAEEFRQLRLHDLNTPASRDAIAARVSYLLDRGEAAFEVEHYRKDGSTFPLLVQSCSTRWGGVDAFLSASWDISALRQAEQALRGSEERMRKLLDKVQNLAVQGYGPDGAVRLWNKASEALYGYTAEEALGRNLVDLIIPPPMRELVQQAIRQMIESGEAHAPEELQLMRKDGTLVPVFSNHTIVETQGIGKELFCIDIDLTDRKRAEAEQQRLQEQLRQAQKLEALGTLAGGIAHDFNNILFAILGFTDLLEESMSPNPDQVECLAGIKSGATRAAELVKQILTFARRSARQRAEINIVPLVKESLKLLRSTLPAYIEFKQLIEPVSAVITADPTEVHQILMNLCTNAGQAMQEHGGELAVALTVIPDYKPAPGTQAAPAYELTVRDTGPGIPANVIDKVFDPFFTTKPVGEGTGMGLAVVHSIVQELGGAISVASSPDTGTAFRIILPASTKSPLAASAEPSALPRGSECVLVLDDEPAIADIIERILSQLGYQAESFTDPAQASAAFLSHPERYDAAVLDQAMQGATGSELAQRFLQVKPRLPVLLCTGHSHNLTPERAQALGIAKFLYKPITRAQLAQALREALDAAPPG